MHNRLHLPASACRTGILLLLSLLSWLVGAQDFPYHFQYLTTDDGLPQNTVDAIYRDSRGFMWFATWNGLCRYDGYELRTFTTRQTGGEGLPDNFVHALAEDGSGVLWVGTAAGIARYDLSQERFLSTAELPGKLRTADISALKEDGKGGVWIGTETGDLYAVPPGSLEAPRPVRLGAGAINALERTADGPLWIGSDDGLWQLAAGADRPERVVAGPVLSLRAEGDTLWRGTLQGLVRRVLPTGAERLYAHDPTDAGSLVHNTVTAIARDPAGHLLLGTLGGLCIYRPADGSFERVTHRTGATPQLNNTFINSLLADTSGNVWIGTEKGGVNRYNLHQHRFGTLSQSAPPGRGLNAATVNSILAEGDLLWLGTAGGGLNRYDRRTGDFTYYQHQPGDPGSISGDFVTSILRDRRGSLWLGTWGNGLNRMDGGGAGGQFRTLSPVPGFISSLQEDPRGFLLVGSESGLYVVDPVTGAANVLTGPGGEPAVREVGCLLADRDGGYWVGTRNGLYHFPSAAVGLGDHRLEAGELMAYRADAADSRSLPGKYILALHQAADGRLWVGTYGHGIAYGEEGTDGKMVFRAYDQEDGLCNDVVYSIEEDESGQLWMGTDHGLANFDPVAETFKNYYAGDGLLSNQFYWSAGHRGADGQLYFGSVAGLNYFRPEQIRNYPHRPRAVLTKLEVLNEAVTAGAVRHGEVTLETAIAEAREINLSYLDNAFSIEFSSLDYFLPGQARFAYQLEGVDQDWVTVSADRRFASYTNLSGGEYTFRVRASNGDGLWQEKPTTLGVIIHPPFWKTLPFRLLVIALLSLAVFGYVRWRIHYLRVQTQKLELQVKRRTLEIERQARELALQRDQLIALNERVQAVNQLRLRFFTNISHEFRTPLTLIIDPIASLLRKFSGSGEDRQTLTVVNRNAQRLLHLINQLMTFRQLEEGKSRVRVRETDVRTYLGEIFGSFSDLAAQRGIDFRLRLPDREGTVWLDEGKVENILYNLLANAFKYTPEGGSIRLSFRRETVDGEPLAVFRVIDTGSGMEADHLGKIFEHFYQSPTTENANLQGSGIGLSLTRELAELLGGTVSATSAPGRGSAFTVSLPCSRSAFPEDALAEESAGPRVGRLAVPVAALRDELHSVPDRREAAAPPQPANGQPLVLVVEDNRELRELLVRSFRVRYRVLQAQDGREGYAMAREHGPDLIVSDIMMPHMDGLELCRRLRTDLETSHIPLVLLTARALIENQLEGLAGGADDYIPKPFDLRLLLARIDNLIASRRRLRELFRSNPAPAPPAATSSPVDDEFLAAVYAVLEEHYPEADFSHDQLAGALFVSRSLLYKKIKSLTDLSVTDFVNVYKLKQAALLLRAGEVTVAEAAYRCGFNDPKYFSRVFKKFYGVSPSGYASGEPARTPLPQH